MQFEVDPRLERDTLAAGDLLLCRLRLMNDSRFPWMILIPRRPGVSELSDLTATERAIAMEEATAVGRALKEMTGALKLNVGALGNIVPQLHIHVVARFAADAAWPGPVWGRGEAVPYEPAAAQTLLAGLRRKMTLG